MGEIEQLMQRISEAQKLPVASASMPAELASSATLLDNFVFIL
jgi:hypothetical protein